ncbi:hypothetical protein B0H63DRAFT_88465 [Podospora didyma]|uniref:FAD-binding domain-containing protein n=1 Tax=Podospora didyma TaxID=330526 RepID=A0AAE0N2N0_9PEZI|nr:hypothetical protein B0H63DRAFT_88465 [Podospora didyma]
MSQFRVLIVGASIAGPTAAYWFAKAGAKVTVLERFPQLRTNGQNVDIRTAGVTVMRKIPDMEAAVRAKTLPIQAISFVRSSGRPYGTIKPTGNPDQQSLVSEYEILRGDLAQVLYDLTKDNENITYIFGEQIASMQQQTGDDGPITVQFTGRSLPASDFDLVVACDGATSRTRALGLNCDVRDHIIRTNSWAAFFSLPPDTLSGLSKTDGQAYSAPGGRFMAAGCDPSDGTIRVSLMAVLRPKDKNKSKDDELEAFRAAMMADDPATLKQFVAQHFAGAGWKCDDAIKAMLDPSSCLDFYANEIVQVKTPALFKSRFVLVGDAGYAPGPTGAGTSLAMAGAYILAGEIHKHKGDLTAGLKGYEERMRPIINDLQKIPPLLHKILMPETLTGIWLRNTVFAFICWSRIMEFSHKFFASSFGSADKYKIPDYDWEV